ncbi:MAG TPA: DUF1003 domain-containing protein, partial [Polyangia bacterium]|nr:DUF1003 domain-containing protein [Polyangia bacterium]
MVYLTIMGVMGWMILNSIWPHVFASRAPDPPPFPGLEVVVSSLAVVITITILTTQTRERQS